MSTALGQLSADFKFDRKLRGVKGEKKPNCAEFESPRKLKEMEVVFLSSVEYPGDDSFFTTVIVYHYRLGDSMDA